MTTAGRCLLAAMLTVCGLPTAAAKTCLVLGGGGARGAAHVGVLKVLERERIAVDCITGTSMGGIVGALYATGYTAAEIEAILAAIDWSATLRDTPDRGLTPVVRKREELRYLLDLELGLGRDGKIRLPAGALQGQQLELLLRRLFLPAWRVERFEDLPIPFRTIATDIISGDGVVLDRGDLALAVRATMSVPGAFAPVRRDGRLLVDGGVAENVPVSLARDLGATRLIAVDVGAGLLPEDKLTSPLAITLQTLSALMVKRTQEQLATLSPNDILIRPELGDIGSASFERVLEAVPAGEAAAQAALPQLRAFALDEAAYAQWRQRHRRIAFDPPLIAFLDVLGERSRTAGYVEQRLSALAGKPLDTRALEEDINRAYAAGDYERIGYRLVERDGSTGLQVIPEDKAWGPGFLRAGLSLSDDFSGRSSYQLSLEGRLTGLNDHGGELRGLLQAGTITGLRLDFRQPFGGVGQYALQPYLDYRAYDQPIALVPGQVLAEFRVREATVGVEAAWQPDAWWQFLLRAETGEDRVDLRIGDPDTFADSESGWGALALELTRDTLDSVQFPKRGSRLELGYTHLVDALGADGDGEAFRFSWDKAHTRGRHTILYGLRGKSASEGTDTVRTASFLGGLANLSGFGEREAFGNHALLARAIYYRRFGRLDALFSVPAYVGGSAEWGGTFFDRDDVDAAHMIAAGSVFVGVDSPLGPVFLGYGRNDLGLDSFYLTFGSLLRALD